MGGRSAIAQRGLENSVWLVARVQRAILRHQGTRVHQGSPKEDIALMVEQISSTLKVSQPIYQS